MANFQGANLFTPQQQFFSPQPGCSYFQHDGVFVPNQTQTYPPHMIFNNLQGDDMITRQQHLPPSFIMAYPVEYTRVKPITLTVGNRTFDSVSHDKVIVITNMLIQPINDQLVTFRPLGSSTFVYNRPTQPTPRANVPGPSFPCPRPNNPRPP